MSQKYIRNDKLMCVKCFHLESMKTTFETKDKYNIADESMWLDVIKVCPKCKEMSMFVTIDRSLAKLIQLLNRKNYITDYCCEGHISCAPTAKGPILATFNSNPYIKFFDKIMDLFSESARNKIFKYWHMLEGEEFDTAIYMDTDEEIEALEAISELEYGDPEIARIIKDVKKSLKYKIDALYEVVKELPIREYKKPEDKNDNVLTIIDEFL